MWKAKSVLETALAMDLDSPAQAEEFTSLLKLAKAGDARAFERILVDHQRRVFLTAFRLLGNIEDAQDAAQEVFLRLHKHLRRFDETRQLSPWLYRITVNVCRDIAKRRGKETHLDLSSWTKPSTQPPGGLEEQRRVVAEALKRLPEKERAAIVLRDIEGVPTREVARILGSSEATVRSQVSSARLKIKQFAERFLGRRS